MDPITDVFNRIKNGQMARKEQVVMPFSEVRFNLIKILKKGDFVTEIKKRGRGAKKVINVVLKYESDGQPALRQFKRISKPGQRIYLKAKELKKVKSGYGLGMVSTSQGIMTNQEARKKNIGGEALVEVW